MLGVPLPPKFGVFLLKLSSTIGLGSRASGLGVIGVRVWGFIGFRVYLYPVKIQKPGTGILDTGFRDVQTRFVEDHGFRRAFGS